MGRATSFVAVLLGTLGKLGRSKRLYVSQQLLALLGFVYEKAAKDEEEVEELAEEEQGHRMIKSVLGFTIALVEIKPAEVY